MNWAHLTSTACRQVCGWLTVIVLAALSVTDVPMAKAQSHGIAMHGAPKYGVDFEALDYVNPHAPKGGELRLAVPGTFDNLNPFIIKGAPARGRHLVFESLLKRTWDEPFSLYGLIAQSISVPEDRSAITFVLRPEARFHDGTPITADDVIFSWETLKEQGRPNHHLYYRQVEKIARLGPHSVQFVFQDTSPDRELPLIIGLMPILSKSYYANVEFEKTTLDPPLASGPYHVESVDPGRSIVYRRDPGYWGRDLPINRGQYNFDTVRYDYYRDGDVMMEAFQAGAYDFRAESSEKRWATAYDFPAVTDGRVALELLPHGRPSGMSAFVFNTRREIFAERAVRQALAFAFDFAWINQTLLYGAYVRTASIFANSDLASDGIPQGRERELLNSFRDLLPEELFAGPYRPPQVHGGLRANLIEAQRRLAESGWTVHEGSLQRETDGRRMVFEILLVDSSNEKIAWAFARNLERLGVEVRIRTVDTPQYLYRLNVYDFDMMIYDWRMSLSPGNEQAFYWGTAAADQEATRNYPGVRDPVVDALIDRMTKVRERDDFVAVVQALDRVLLWGHYFVPLYHLNDDRIAYWDRLIRPEKTPLYGPLTETWWHASAAHGKAR